MNKVGKIIASVLIVLMLVGAIGLIIKFTNGGTTDFKTFYVEIGGKTYLDNGEYELLQGENRFETKYTFVSNKEENHKGYNVKIVPNTTDETNFEFTVDGQNYSFADEKDLIKGFDVRQDKTGFVINNDGLSMLNILQNCYSDKTVEIDVSRIDYSNTYFNVIVSSYNGGSSVVIGIKFNVPVTGINLDKDGVVF